MDSFQQAGPLSLWLAWISVTLGTWGAEPEGTVASMRWQMARLMATKCWKALLPCQDAVGGCEGATVLRFFSVLCHQVADWDPSSITA